MPVTFDPFTAGRILDATRRVEGSPTDPRVDDPPAESAAPETFFAKIPVGGIPARSGTTLGSASCDIYRDALASWGSTTRQLQAVTVGGTQITRVIHNSSTTAIDGTGGDVYLPITRTKHGAWVPFLNCG